MIALLLSAALLANLGDRPPEFLSPGGIEDYSAWLTQAALDSDAGFFHGACEDASAISLSNTPFDAEVAREGIALPPHQGPVIKEMVRVAGCGHSSLQNLIVIHPTQGGWIARRMLPGASMAPGATQMQALQTGVLNAVMAGKPKLACGLDEFANSMRILDVSLVTAPKDKKPWTERWSIQACGADRSVAVTFTPKANGAPAYVVKPAW